MLHNTKWGSRGESKFSLNSSGEYPPLGLWNPFKRSKMAKSLIILLVPFQTQNRLCPMCWFANVLCGGATERCLTLEEAWGSLAEEVVRVEESAEMSPQPFHISYISMSSILVHNRVWIFSRDRCWLSSQKKSYWDYIWCYWDHILGSYMMFRPSLWLYAAPVSV